MAALGKITGFFRRGRRVIPIRGKKALGRKGRQGLKKAGKSASRGLKKVGGAIDRQRPRTLVEGLTLGVLGLGAVGLSKSVRFEKSRPGETSQQTAKRISHHPEGIRGGLLGVLKARKKKKKR